MYLQRWWWLLSSKDDGGKRLPLIRVRSLLVQVVASIQVFSFLYFFSFLFSVVVVDDSPVIKVPFNLWSFSSLRSFFVFCFLPFSFSASPVSKAIHNFIFLHQSPFSLSFYLSNNTKGYLARLITYKSIVFFSLSPKRFYIFLPQKTAAWAIKERKKKS